MTTGPLQYNNKVTVMCVFVVIRGASLSPCPHAVVVGCKRGLWLMSPPLRRTTLSSLGYMGIATRVEPRCCVCPTLVEGLPCHRIVVIGRPTLPLLRLHRGRWRTGVGDHVNTVPFAAVSSLSLSDTQRTPGLRLALAEVATIGVAQGRGIVMVRDLGRSWLASTQLGRRLLQWGCPPSPHAPQRQEDDLDYRRGNMKKITWGKLTCPTPIDRRRTSAIPSRKPVLGRLFLGQEASGGSTSRQHRGAKSAAEPDEYSQVIAHHPRTPSMSFPRKAGFNGGNERDIDRLFRVSKGSTGRVDSGRTRRSDCLASHYDTTVLAPLLTTSAIHDTEARKTKPLSTCRLFTTTHQPAPVAHGHTADTTKTTTPRGPSATPLASPIGTMMYPMTDTSTAMTGKPTVHSGAGSKELTTNICAKIARINSTQYVPHDSYNSNSDGGGGDDDTTMMTRMVANSGRMYFPDRELIIGA
ncbi:hypothetical protein EDB85DRAFT_1886347 [Lactarius pseudohatsudake]|nr:hypothetical protein EDB85DRAFT_1886347 [Lactarius pseudohatsudake]